ncbi:hypothetical protein K438DRAFT_1789818 [Mycena galopus ATCC 62051]|nr:hypothetical protein K438DRAFT_1789818 [Mycena galopus ATCC 62051]
MIPVPDLTRSPLFVLALVVAGSEPELEALDLSEPLVGVGWAVVDVVNPEVTALVAGDAEAEAEPGEPGFEPEEFPSGDTDPSFPMLTSIAKPFAAQRCSKSVGKTLGKLDENHGWEGIPPSAAPWISERETSWGNRLPVPDEQTKQSKKAVADGPGEAIPAGVHQGEVVALPPRWKPMQRK